MATTPYDFNPYVQQALEFIKTHDLGALPAGRHVIDGDNLWVNIVDSDLRTVGDARLEAHAQYIDVQVPLSGTETFGIKSVSACTAPDGEMDDRNDILFYKDPIEETVTIQPGEPVIFGPDTAHAPLIGEGRIHKAIFKARVPYSCRKASGGRYLLSIRNHQEIMPALAAFCEEKGIHSGIVGGLAAIGTATFRFFDPGSKQYVDRTFDEQMEVCSLVGNISTSGGRVYLHVHVTASRSDYSCIGGHLLSARVSGACELFVEDYGLEGVGRRFESETGLNLYDFDAV